MVNKTFTSNFNCNGSNIKFNKVDFRGTNSRNGICNGASIKKKIVDSCDGQKECSVNEAIKGCDNFNMDISYACVSEIGNPILDTNDQQPVIEAYEDVKDETTELQKRREEAIELELAAERAEKLASQQSMQPPVQPVPQLPTQPPVQLPIQLPPEHQLTPQDMENKIAELERQLATSSSKYTIDLKKSSFGILNIITNNLVTLSACIIILFFVVIAREKK